MPKERFIPTPQQWVRENVENKGLHQVVLDLMYCADLPCYRDEWIDAAFLEANRIDQERRNHETQFASVA